MLEEFLKVAYRQQQNAESKKELQSLVDKLPLADLYKLATTGKLAHESTTPANSPGWLEQFKGTALLPAAVELEQKEIQTEAQIGQQYAIQEEGYREKDKINIEKRLLEVQLAQHEASEGEPTPEQHGLSEQVAVEASEGAQQQAEQPPVAPPAPPAPGAPPDAAKMAAAMRFSLARMKLAGPLMDPNTGGPQKAAEGLGAGPTPSLAQPGAMPMKMAEAMGRLLAQKDAQKLAGLADLATKGLETLKSNPHMAIGAAVGGAAGLAHGLHKDEQGHRHIVGGLLEGAAGAGLGAVAGRAVQHGLPEYQKSRALQMGHLESMGHGLQGAGRGLRADLTGVKNTALGDKQVKLPGF